MGSARPALTIHHGERRIGARVPSAHGGQVRVLVEGHEFLGVIESGECGRITIRTQEDPNLSKEEAFDLKITDGDKTIVSGQWSLLSVRSDTSGTALSFENAYFKFIKSMSERIPSDVFLKTNRYRILQSEREADLIEIGQHFTEIKDFIATIDCTVHLPGKSIQGSFTFASGAKDLDQIDIDLPENPEIQSGTQATIEYTFLSVRYLFQARALEYDDDFKVLSIEPPQILFAIVSRGFDRLKTELQVEIVRDGQISFGKVTEISCKGCTIAIPESHRKLGQVSVAIKAGKLLVESSVVRQSNTSLGVRFITQTENQLNAIRELLRLSLPSPIVERTEKNYDLFRDLYMKVGYGPKNESDISLWKETSAEAWRYQDRVLPLNSVGAQVENEIVSAIGTLPISTKMVYAHSVAILKTAEAAGTFFQEAVLSLYWSELIPEITHYAGSYSKRSRFTARLQVAFETHARPEHQQLIHTVALKEPLDVSQMSTDVSVSLCSLEVIKEYSESLYSLLSLFIKPHPLIQDAHKAELYSIHQGGAVAPVGFLLAYRSPEYFTAAQMFDFNWVFLKPDTKDMNGICKSLACSKELSGRPMEVTIEAGGHAPGAIDGFASQDQAFWALTPKDDLGPILCSISRAVYSVLKKYGPAAQQEVMRLL